jgi:hypothetical protein
MEKGMPRLNNFQIFVRRMYYKNCREREDNGQKPYSNHEEYFNKNENFLKDKYQEKKDDVS